MRRGKLWGKYGSTGERGQATVEFALVLPLVVLFALITLQLGTVAKDILLVHHAAREGARAAAVEPTSAAARTAVLGATTLDSNRLSVSLSGETSRGGQTTATVRYRSPTNVPLVGVLVPDVMLEASVTMRVE